MDVKSAFERHRIISLLVIRELTILSSRWMTGGASVYIDCVLLGCFLIDILHLSYMMSCRYRDGVTEMVGSSWDCKPV